jgi:hypothetical protein
MNYDLSQIRDGFLGLVKFKRDFYANTIDSDLIGTSASKLYFNSGTNPLVTLRNINAIVPLASDLSFDTWSALTTYSKDDVVISSSKYYRSKVNTNLNHLVTDTDYWFETTITGIYVREKIWSVIETVISEVIKSDKLFDHKKLYNLTDNSDLITNSSNFVGFEVNFKSSDHLLVTINKIASQFSENESFTLYLYNQNTKVKEITITSNSKELSFDDIDDVDLSGEGRWFLYYDQDDLTGQAYNWPLYSNSSYIDIKSFEVPNTTTDFINSVNSWSFNSYGLGLDYSVKCDLTSFLLSNKLIFAEAIHLQFQYTILETFLYNPDVKFSVEGRNMELQAIQEKIAWELKSGEKFSLGKRLQDTYKNLLKSLDFGEPALPGANDIPITFNSFG